MGRILLVLAVVAIAMGAMFIYQGISKDQMVRGEMQAEKVTYGLPQEAIDRGEVIDNAAKAQKVADTVREHRHRIAPTYNDLLKGGKYDPTNLQHLTYSQAINLENYLYLGVLALGLTTVVLASGVFMIVAGIAIGATGVALLAVARKNAWASNKLGSFARFRA